MGKHTIRWPADRVHAGDWTPVQWYDGEFAAIVAEIEASSRLEPLGNCCSVGPAGQRIRDAFKKCDKDASEAARVFWSVSAKLRRMMRGSPEQWSRPKPGREALADRYWKQRSHFLVAQKYRTTNGLVTGLWSPVPSVGSGWVPVTVKDGSAAKALAAWWNSTPARLMLLNRRSKTLDYPAWSLAQLRSIRVPRTGSHTAWDALSSAFESTCNMELLPLKHAERCRVRRIIDEAAALVLGVDTREVAGWRRRLSREPTVSNLRAAPAGRK